jgi:hypothetical protein
MEVRRDAVGLRVATDLAQRRAAFPGIHLGEAGLDLIGRAAQDISGRSEERLRVSAHPPALERLQKSRATWKMQLLPDVALVVRAVLELPPQELRRALQPQDAWLPKAEQAAPPDALELQLAQRLLARLLAPPQAALEQLGLQQEGPHERALAQWASSRRAQPQELLQWARAVRSSLSRPPSSPLRPQLLALPGPGNVFERVRLGRLRSSLSASSFL